MKQKSLEGKVLKTIQAQDLISKGDVIILGLSGGPDSVALFNALLNLRRILKFHIEAVHVNHKLRPVDAELDQKYVEDLCRDKEINLHLFEYDCNEIAKKSDETTEEIGRRVRYESYAKAANSIKTELRKIKIAVAHNANDQAETLLQRIIRGTGTDGLGCMEYIRDLRMKEEKAEDIEIVTDKVIENIR
ncbi:MAG: tRNA lysidine(34) synthetase TilS, partial [Anaerovoracaceae bacterium]